MVDDEALIRWSLAQELAKAGYDVVEAADGAGALATFAARGPFDLVVLDLKLPDIDGFVLLGRIREISSDCGVVMMSAFATPEDLARADGHGIGDIVAKPFDMLYMLAFIDAALRRARSGPS